MAKTLGVTFAIGASVNPSVTSAFATVDQKIRASQERTRELARKAQTLAAADAAKQRVAATQKLFAESGGRDPMLREALTRETAAFHKAAQAAKAYGVEISGVSRACAVTNRALNAARQRLEALQKARSFKEKRQEAADSAKTAAVSLAVVGEPVREAIRFESAMASAAKTIDGMRDESGKLTAKYYEMEAAIKAMGRTLPLTHDELAKLFAAGGQQGMTAVADLREFATLAAQMAVAFDMSDEEAADSIGGFRSALKLSMPEARNLLDLMNQYANATSASEKGIADVVRRIGSLGAVGGVAAPSVTALAATLDAMKVAPEVAATGIKNLILAMTAGTAATKSQKAAYSALGIDAVKLAKQMQTDGPAAIVSVLEAVKKLPKAERLSTMQQIFGKESLGSIAPLLDNLDKVKENLEICGDKSKYAGAMQKEFDNVSGTTANKLILLKNRVQEVGITIAANLLPAIQAITETIGPPISAIAKFAGEHKSLTTAAMGVAASLVALKMGVAAGTWVISGMAGALNLAKAALIGFSAVTKAASGFQIAFNALMSANPVGLAATAVAALVAGMTVLYNTCEPVRAIFDKAFSWIGEKIQAVASSFSSLASGFKSGIKAVGSFLGFGGGDKPEETENPKTAAPGFSAAVEMPAAAKPVAASSLRAAASEIPAATAKSAATGAGSNSFAEKTGDPSAQNGGAKAAAIPDLPQTPDISAIIASFQESANAASPAKNANANGKQAATPQVSVAINVAQSGIPDQTFAQGVINAIRARQAELEAIISGIVSEQARVAYGS